MGWFDSIVNGLGSAVNWVSQNSGTILNVAGTVAKVAGLVVMTEEEKELMEAVPKSDVADLQVNFNKATQYLVETAQKATPQSALEAGTDPRIREAAHTTTATLPGIWTSPAPLDESGNPVLDIVQDTTKFLHQQLMPTILKIGGSKQDVAKLIGQAVFGNGPDSHVSDDKSDLVQAPTFEIKNDDGSCTITGCMAYYPIPMGQAENAAQDITSLHSALHVKTSTTRRFRVEQAMERRSKCFSPDPSQYTVTSSGWLVTLQVAWTALQIADQAWPLIRDGIKKQDQDLEIRNNQQQGNLQVIKIKAGRNTSPNSVKSALTAAVSGALKALVTPAMYINDNTISTIATQLPSIVITNSTLSYDDRSLSDNLNDKVANNVQGDFRHVPVTAQSAVRDIHREAANQTQLAVRNSYRGSSDGSDWTEVGNHMNGDVKQMDMPVNKRGVNVNRGDWR